MKKHLKRREKIKDDKSKEEPAEQDDDDDYDPSEPLSSVVDISAAVKSKKSKVWNFFTILDKDVARCKICEVTRSTKNGNPSSMTKHLFRAHSDLYNQLEEIKQKEKLNYNYKCKYCEKIFSTKGNFKQHLNTKHFNTSRYKCEICGKGFDVKSKLERHVKSPTVHIVKPFKCDYCPVTFNNKKYRTTHVKEFHLNQN